MIDVLAIGATSPLGEGEAAWSNGPPGAPARSAIQRDARLVAAGLRKPFAARVAPVDAAVGDPATAILLRALAPLEGELPRGARLGVAIGTSSGGMASAERFFAARARGDEIDAELARDATYHAPFRALLARLAALPDVAPLRTAHLLTACSSSTLAIGLAMRWLALGACDVALAGGYDALTVFVAAGFEALGATTGAPPPRPSRVGRDGMSLGEGAALLLLARAGDPAFASRAPLARLAGFGASGDAVHLTAPDREGGGLARAAERALDDAGIAPAAIGLASVHGTSTAFNDPMEAKALARALDESRGGLGAAVPIQAAKATIGHALGAAGALETSLAIDALRRDLLPATPGEGELDPDAPAGVRAASEPRALTAALKLSSAFGGANAALVITKAFAPSRPCARVAVASRIVDEIALDAAPELAALSAALGLPRERLARMDATSHLALAAVAALSAKTGREALRGAALVVGTCLATIDVNAIYDEGMRKRGAPFAEGRRFAYTTPNAAAGECAIAFGLTGPNLAVGRGEDAWREAEEIARDLIAAGDARRAVVIGLDADGPAARLQAERGGFAVRFGARALLLEGAAERST